MKRLPKFMGPAIKINAHPLIQQESRFMKVIHKMTETQYIYFLLNVPFFIETYNFPNPPACNKRKEGGGGGGGGRHSCHIKC